jgi:ribose transport system ATP-binding protein
MSWCATSRRRASPSILTSDTLEETIGLSHRVLVMRDGAVTHRAFRCAARQQAGPRSIWCGHMVWETAT